MSRISTKNTIKKTNTIYLNSIGSYLTYELDDLHVSNRLPIILYIYVEKNGVINTITIDERFNTINISKETYELMWIKNIYNELKMSSPNYGSYEIYTQSTPEWEPTENILIEDFLEYLKKSNRDFNINKIIK